VNADLSVAPEIAQLAASPVPPPGPAEPIARTAGQLAAGLSGLAAAPQRWWDLVRFDPDGPARIPVPGADGAWLLVLPPGATADCDCRYATLLAGEASETPLPPPATAQALRPGRVRVHGRAAPHQIHGAGHGYSVSLHWAGATARSEETRDFHPERTVAAVIPPALPPAAAAHRAVLPR
jgi:hypothetical protein